MTKHPQFSRTLLVLYPGHIPSWEARWRIPTTRATLHTGAYVWYARKLRPAQRNDIYWLASEASNPS